MQDEFYVYDGIKAEDPPIYRDHGWRLHVKLNADLGKIPARLLKKSRGKDGKEYYRVDYDIKAKFCSAHTEYSLWYRNVCYGSVEANYE